jgi:tetratricopeptide (TPR) repeat protein
MARTEAQRNKRAKANARHRKRPGGGVAQVNQNDTLFFPRLRTHAKWMFVALAIVFSISFVAFGVGSGSTGISDVFNNGLSFFGGGSGGSSISKLQRAAAKHPQQAQRFRDLATALETKNRNDEAIAALATYTKLNPKDTSALSELAGLYLKQADNAQTVAQAASDAATPVTGGGIFGPSSTSKLGQAFATNPLVQAVGSKADTIISAQRTIALTAANNAIATYKRLAKATPGDASVQLELAQAAEGFANYAVAVAAYKQFLKLAPHDPSAAAVKARIKQLQPALKK